ncbi:hypothetical protein KKC32_01515 [Patescibacteria group bacterium]|nr:hypothetical protein [Patescibacteria group bacterium]
MLGTPSMEPLKPTICDSSSGKKIKPDQEFLSEKAAVKEQLSAEEMEKILETREVIKEMALDGGANKSVCIRLKDDGDAIFKPKSGEKIKLRSGIEAGSYFQRERAAYLVSKYMGFDFVPPTVIREVGNEIGSSQEFIADAQLYTERVKQISFALDFDYDVADEYLYSQMEGQFIKLWVYDIVIFNSDRHGNNFLIKDNKIVPIDHGLSMGDSGLKTYYSCYDEPIPADVQDLLEKFSESTERQSQLKQELLEILPEELVAKCFARIDKVTRIIMDKGCIPAEEEEKIDPFDISEPSGFDELFDLDSSDRGSIY